MSKRQLGCLVEPLHHCFEWILLIEEGVLVGLYDRVGRQAGID
jgi:hypothetical protein